jgi:hypothetical protein
METPLNASSSTAGALMSGSRFRVPEFQREYAWEREEVSEFIQDLSQALQDDTYFLGLIIQTGSGAAKDIVDGQQRLLTLTLLAAALYHEAKAFDRKALAERIQSTFLRSIDFESDDEIPRLQLSGTRDNETLHQILEHPARDLAHLQAGDDTVSALLLNAYRIISERLVADLASDPFKRLGLWADFLTNKLYLASFVHPNPASAYRVFEVINTRGKELTTADLLKSYVLSQTPNTQRQERYNEWQSIARHFSGENASIFVQFIRHVVTTERGHVPPRDLYDVLAAKGSGAKRGMTPTELIHVLQRHQPLYMQMMDPTADGPAHEDMLGVFSVLNELNVISVRPILLAISETDRAGTGMREMLRLVVRRVVVGNLGTGNVERRFGQTAQRIESERAWEPALAALSDLNPGIEEFKSQVHRRSFNRNVLAVVRQSVIQQTITPEPEGYPYLIKPRDSHWSDEDEDRAGYWASTIGNAFLATEARRPMGSSSWAGFRAALLPYGVDREWKERIASYDTWNIEAISTIGEEMAEAAARVWYE